MAARVLIASDDFNRADGALGANWADIDPTWGTVSITSNKVGGGSGEGAASRWIGAGSFIDDQYASVVVGGIATTNDWVGAMVRVGAGTNASRSYYLLAFTDTAPQQTYLVKVVVGTSTTLKTDTSVSWANGDRIEIEVEGTTLRGMKNGVALGGGYTVTDSSISSGLPGIWCNSNTHLITGDDWQGGNLVAALPFFMPAMKYRPFPFKPGSSNLSRF
jgi:hypothetical protein